MERLCKVAILAVLSYWGACAAEPYCSLHVEATAPNGKRPVVLVKVIEPNGRTTTKFQRSQDVQFCNLGILPVTVQVGPDNSCNEVVVHEVPVQWQEPYHLKVTYDPCAERAPRFPSPEMVGCEFLFRVTDTAGGPIAGAFVQIQPSSIKEDTDAYGRALVGVKVGDFTAAISASGYTEQTFRTSCTREKSGEPQEQWIKLTPTSKRQ